MKKYLSLFIIFLLAPSMTLAADKKSDIAFTKHLQRITEICKQYETKTSATMLSYSGVTKNDGIFEAKQIYRTNMTNIYKCAILETQKKSLENIKNELIKNNPDLNKSIAPKIEQQIEKITENKLKIKCSTSKDTDKDGINKLNILKETSAEMCRYVSYLEYLRDYNSDYANILANDADAQSKTSLAISSKNYNLSSVIALEKMKKSQIDDEIKHTYKIFPMAYDVYNQYENNITIHLLLELIKQDYVTYRQKLHETLNPINQVVYKIANAMKK